MDWLTNEMKTLLAGGFFGTAVRVMLKPDKGWRKWLVQMFVGLSAAIFLGQILGHIITSAVGQEAASAAYYAAGYIIGTAAEKVIEKIQEKFLT